MKTDPEVILTSSFASTGAQKYCDQDRIDQSIEVVEDASGDTVSQN